MQMSKVEFGDKVITLRSTILLTMLDHPTLTPIVIHMLPDMTGNQR